jgi:hypothetical protein
LPSLAFAVRQMRVCTGVKYTAQGRIIPRSKKPAPGCGIGEFLGEPSSPRRPRPRRR